jgi:hypothetical protein
MGNVVDKLCERCHSNKQFSRGYCSGCYKFQIRNGVIIAKKRGKSPTILTDIQSDILIGSLLGDGFLSNRKNPTLRINRSIKDKDYLLWEYSIFKDYCDREPWITEKLDKETGKIYYGISFETRASQVFSKYRKEWYPNGEKLIPPDLMLKSRAIAIWFCDDGCILYLQYLKKDGEKSTMPYLKLATNGFSKNDVDLLSQLLSAKYNQDFPVAKSTTGYIINGYKNATEAIMNDISIFVPSSMCRKLTKWEKRKSRRKYILSGKYAGGKDTNESQ